MTSEEADKKIEFILQMQAQFEANLGRLEANLARSESNIDKLRESQATLTGAAIRITELMEQSQKQSDQRFRGLDERLNALITVVEKHITGPDHERKAR
jgi:septal ring factor EnvC (AmiA/AmiB activator)